MHGPAPVQRSPLLLGKRVFCDSVALILRRSGYQHYSLVTSEEIEKMRMDERLKVVRGLEENTMKSACRRVTSDLLQPNAVIGKPLKSKFS